MSNKIEAKLDSMDNKLDNLDQRVDVISETMIINTAQLKEHMRRTDLLETYVNQEVEPMKKYIQAMKYGVGGVMWLAIALAGLAGFVLTLQQLGVLKL